MALDARHRSSLYDTFVPLIGEENANALMSQFPASEAEELVTKDFLRAELAITRGELRSEMADLRDGLRGEMAELRDGLADLRGSTANLGASLRGEMAELRVGLADVRNDLTLRMTALVAAATAVLGTLITLT